jgi:hypothetical protein
MASAFAGAAPAHRDAVHRERKGDDAGDGARGLSEE